MWILSPGRDLSFCCIATEWFAEALAPGIQVAQADPTQMAERPGDDGEGGLQLAGDAPEFHGVLQWLRIERPPLSTANVPSTRQTG